ncbi:sin3 complex subunit [Seiridium cupressi]
MAFRFALPTSDGRLHKEEEITLLRNASQRIPSEKPQHIDGTSIPPAETQDTPVETTISPGPNRRHVVFADPVAFRYLEEDPCVSVVERRGLLRGYELYLVEQWACSRQSPTLVLVTYTGDQRHSVVVGVLSVPEDETTWPPRLRVYFGALQKYHARPKDTTLGQLMVTNLSSFPSALTVIPVPDGDIRKHRQGFIVNENLKRLGCSGRSGMTLSEPSGAAKAKFYQLYKTNEKIPFSEAVVELIKLCQVALFIFGKLEQEYIDGLLCDMTETAVGDWWTEFGADCYNMEPNDGMLGPSTVAALLGLLMGSRNRLSYYGAPIAKDVFDIDNTKRGISYFQKSQKLDRTRRLDRQTLHRLRHVTAKAAAGEGWGVQKAVKSTVSEIGGKRGEIVLGMVGGRDKGGIGDIETLDLDKFISLAHGERAKWLWLGKPRRTAIDHQERTIPDMSNILFGKEEQQLQPRRTQSIPIDEELEVQGREELSAVYSAPAPGSATSIAADSPAEKDALRRAVFKSVAGKIGDARSGLGRIKDAVYSGGGLRGHASRSSKDESSEMSYSGTAPPSILTGSSAALVASPTPGGMNRAFTWKNRPEEYRDAFRDVDATPAPPSEEFLGMPPGLSQPVTKAAEDDVSYDDTRRLSHIPEIRNELTKLDTSINNTAVVAPSELQGPAVAAEKRFDQSVSQLHRRHSLAGTQAEQQALNENRWPRRLSFSEAEEAVSRWTDLTMLDDAEDTSTEAVLDKQTQLAELARSLYMNIMSVKQTVEPWVDSKITSIEHIQAHYAKQQDDLQSLYYQLTEAYRHTKDSSEELIAGERAQITEAAKEVEVLVAKLDYEIDALISRVGDVEDGVTQFEAQVEVVEKKAEELKAQLETESWLHWAVRTMTGIGTGPNITQE